METKNVSTIYRSNAELEAIDLLKLLITEVESDLNEILSANDWTKIENKKLYFIKSRKLIIADSTRQVCEYQGYPTQLDGIDVAGRRMGYNLAKSLFYDCKSTNPLVSGDSVKNADGNVKDYVACIDTDGYENCIQIKNGSLKGWNWKDTDSIAIPVLKSEYDRDLITFIRYGLIPSETSIPKKYDLLFRLFCDGKLLLNSYSIKYKYSDIIAHDLYSELRDNFITSINKEQFKKELLCVDKIRADIEEYDPTILTDIGVGHWDLWELSKEKEYAIPLSETLVARDPHSDVLTDGIIGIDFGTRSTVVGYQNGSEYIHLLRIGKGDLRSRATKSDYENPTIIEFNDIEEFIKCYKAKVGRPNTTWEDVKVSHTANIDFNNNTKKEDSENFYSYFYNLKQWCGSVNSNHAEKIRSMRTGYEITLPKYVDLSEEEIDPIEIYAYYLGLYINNMRNKIYMRYLMSFPVTYEKRVREKILNSFRKGLRKSLPETIVNDAETMKNFEVVEGAGEPASYAVCALKEYDCAPGDDSVALYGIFDFGGGTTDFDFGIWRYSDEDSIEEERYDYVIEHFGAGGSQYLGGENLLELLAFEIFKANKSVLLDKHITFTKPSYADAFDEMEDLVANTQIAKRNTKQLAEKLREFLEKSISLKNNDASEYNLSFPEGEVNNDTVIRVIEYLVKKGNVVQSYSELCYLIYILKEQSIITTTVSQADVDAICKNLGIDLEIDTTKQVDKFAVYEVQSDYEPIRSGSIKVGLFSTDGEYNGEIELLLAKDNQKYVDILEILISQIEIGVKNFCHAFLQAVSTPEFKSKNVKVSNIYIFLAGNSSKSPIVKNLFNKYIKESFVDLCKFFGVDYNQNLFLMPPLGSDEADTILQSKGINLDAESLTRPTGKTGVVYGLIESRKGGTILVKNANVENDEIPFKFYVGIKKRAVFKSKLSKNSNYGEWVRLVNAQIKEFELYYTSLPAAFTGNLPISDSSIKKKNLKTEYVSDDVSVSIYIRPIKPGTIEYCVAAEEGLVNNEYLQNPIEVNLV